MIIFKFYDKEKLLDKVWYNSSNVIYSECYDKPNDFKELKVVFKGGSTYLYKNVDVNDYVMFKHGGIDGSNGKALNRYIKPKCEYERLDNTDLEQLNEEMEKIKQMLLEQKQKELEETKKEETVETESSQDNTATTED